MVQDHLGDTFSSTKEMCNHYSISINTFYYRKRQGRNIQECLCPKTELPKIQKTKPDKIKDHLGKGYPSKQALCDAYGLSLDAFIYRIKKGWDLENALTTPVNGITPIKDHLGQEYPNKKALCDAYGIRVDTFQSRIKIGWNLKKALTTPVAKKRISIKDHLGQEYPNKKALCDAYGINIKNFHNRIKIGWSLENALTTPINEIIPIKDHLGQEYANKKTLCAAYGINVGTFQSRIKKGWSLKEALINPIIYECVDPFGNQFSSTKEMAELYKIDSPKYTYRIQHMWSNIEALELIPRITHKAKNLYINNQITIIRNIKDDKNTPTQYYEVQCNGEKTIMTYNAIIELCTEILRKEHENGK